MKSIFISLLSFAIMGFPNLVNAQNVNPLNGNFSYSVPLVSVPGPTAAIPININYSPGIKVHQQSSWCGLGWNYHPGAITRMVKNIPDDRKDGQLSILTWNEGNTVSDFGLTLTLGGGPVSASYYWSLGGDMSGGLQSQITAAGFYLKPNEKALPMNLPAGLNQESGGITVPLFGVSGGMLGWRYQYFKWWLYKKDRYSTFGALYSKYGLQTSTINGLEYQDPSIWMDVSQNLGKDQYNDNEASNTLNFPGFDQYTVSGPGIGGSLSPKVINNYALAGSRKEYSDPISGSLRDYTLNYLHRADLNFTSEASEIYFKFSGEVSGYYENSPGTLTIPSNSQDPVNDFTTAGASQSYINSNGESFYDSSSDRIGGANHVSWFSNQDIYDANQGINSSGASKVNAARFMEDPSISQARNDTSLVDPDGIGGFTITTPSGLSYHYAIPVYQFEEIHIAESIQNPEGNYSEKLSFDKYAYSWLLTGVTGPDFIDENSNGRIDDGDKGYWVKYEYGKWSDGYVWRAPYNGYGAQNKVSGTYQFGRKQIYYLDRIETATHEALFVKSVREDNVGADLGRDVFRTTDVFTNQPPQTLPPNTLRCDGNPVANGNYILQKEAGATEYIVPEKTRLLKLDKIILRQKSNGSLTISKSQGAGMIANPTANVIFKYFNAEDWISVATGATVKVCLPEYDIQGRQYFPENVFDGEDLQADPSILQNSIRVVDFTYDYSLSPSNPNSIANNGGKLTLTEVKINGLNNSSVAVPSTRFDYGQSTFNPPYNAAQVDYWGFYGLPGDHTVNTESDAWSLKTIESPTGGEVSIEYESNSYSQTAIQSAPPTMEVEQMERLSNSEVELTLTNPVNINSWYTIGNYYSIDAFGRFYTIPNGVICFNNNYVVSLKGSFELKSVDQTNHKLVFEIPSGIGTYKTCSSENDLSDWTYDLPDQFEGGHITPASGIYEGGGIRVKKMTVDDQNGQILTTVYDYSDPSTGVTSGITSYAPENGGQVPYIQEVPGPGVMYEYVTITSQSSTGETGDGMRYRFDVLKPSVGNFSSATFSLGNHLEVLGAVQHEPSQNINGIITNTSHRTGIVHNRLSALGRVLSTENLDAFGRTLRKTEYLYSDTLEIGAFQEVYTSLKVLSEFENNTSNHLSDHYFITQASRKLYPNFLVSKKEVVPNYQRIVNYSDFDLITGSPQKISTTDEYGNINVGETKYLRDLSNNYSDMGSALFGGSNQLRVIGWMKSSISSDGGNSFDVINASTQEWEKDWTYLTNNQTGNFINRNIIWHPSRTYVWKGRLNAEGTYNSDPQNGDLFQDFDFQNPLANGWVMTKERQLYNENSISLESKDLEGRYTALRQGYGVFQRVLTSGSNAKLSEFTFSGAEDLEVSSSMFGGQIRKGVGAELYQNTSSIYSPTGEVYYDVKTHTGDFSLKLDNSNDEGFIYEGLIIKNNFSNIVPSEKGLLKNRKYRVSVWVRGEMMDQFPENVELFAEENGNLIQSSTLTQGADFFRAGTWWLLTMDIDFSSIPTETSGIKIGVRKNNGTNVVYVDDFRFHPIDMPISSYVYDQQTGAIIAILNGENIASLYRYDNAGELIGSSIESQTGFRKVLEKSYNYGRDN